MLERKLEEPINTQDTLSDVKQMELRVNTTIDFFILPLAVRVDDTFDFFLKSKDEEEILSFKKDLSKLKVELIQVYTQAKKNNNTIVVEYIENYMQHLSYLKETIQSKNDEKLPSAVDNLLTAVNIVSKAWTPGKEIIACTVAALAAITGAILGAICSAAILGGFCFVIGCIVNGLHLGVGMALLGGSSAILPFFCIGMGLGFQKGYRFVEKHYVPEIEINDLTTTVFTRKNIHLFFSKHKILHEGKPPIMEKIEIQPLCKAVRV